MPKFDWKKTVAAVAPSLATALGGPVAGMAASIAVKALGKGDTGDTQKNIEQIGAAVASGDPNVFVQLQNAEQSYQLELERLGLEHEQIHAADRADARAMAAQTTLKPQMILSTIFVAAFAVLLFIIFGAERSLDDNTREPALYLLGILSAGMVQIMNFWFGSSSGSRNKDAAMMLRKQ